MTTENKEMVKVEEKKYNEWDEALKNESWVPPLVDIIENEDNYLLMADMPGVERNNIKIKIEDGYLILMGRINFDKMKNQSYVLKEKSLGNFYRKFKISDSVDDSDVEAKYENGQLMIRLAKSERMKTKIISID